MRRGSRLVLCVFLALSAPAFSTAQSPDECLVHPDNLQKLLDRMEPVLEVAVRRGRYRIHMDAVPEGKEAEARAALSRVGAQLDAVPACILNSHGDGDAGTIDVYIHTDPSYAGAHYAPTIDWQTLANEIRDILANGTIGEVAEPGEQEEDGDEPLGLDIQPGAIHLTLGVLGDDWADAWAKPLAVSPQELRDSGYTLDGVSLHEAAHHWDMFGMPDKVAQFVALDFNAKYDAYVNDPRTRKTADAIRAAYAREPQDRAEIARLEKELTAIYRSHRLPSRFPNDRHAADDPYGTQGGRTMGAREYWAMTIEMFAFQPEKLCTYLSPREIEWLQRNVGDCLEQIPAEKRPSCWK